MFEFASLWALALLPLPLLMYLLPKQKQANTVALKVPLAQIHVMEAQQSASTSNKPRHILIWLIWLCLVLAAAKPQWLGEPVSLPNEGRDIMLAVDLSGSMDTPDMTINGREVDRLTMVKYVMSDFIQRRIGDSLGLILFADTAYLQTPLTRDRNTVSQMLDESVLGLVGKRTAIGDAMTLAAKRFKEKENSNRVLILLTDGQNTAGNVTPEEALEVVLEENIKIYTIGVASDKVLGGGWFGFGKRSASADLDENLLSQLAKATGGEYFRARKTSELAQIYQHLDRLEPISSETLQMRPLTSLFYYPLAVALLLTVLMALSALLSQQLGLNKLAMRNSKNG
ncbi:VWA domain-containing protein [Catenovulum sp. SM1970]|nr:VWA domain-containing protein [Marinifaba aquimaris]NTS77846.1 VWA domain-containing protein [Marinifaba aquimaris]